jgi:hypothetical protein
MQVFVRRAQRAQLFESGQCNRGDDLRRYASGTRARDDRVAVPIEFGSVEVAVRVDQRMDRCAPLFGGGSRRRISGSAWVECPLVSDGGVAFWSIPAAPVAPVPAGSSQSRRRVAALDPSQPTDSFP